MKLLKMFFAVSILLTAAYSCQKDEVTPVLDEVKLSQQETVAEQTLSDVDLLADEAIDQKFGLLKSANIAGFAYLSDCPVITVNKTATPQVMTIDFGTSCTGADGKVRSGKITITSTAFNVFPSVRDFTFDNYVVDGKKIEGSLTKTITKDQENNIRTATIAENVTLTFADNQGKATRVANLTRQYQRAALLNPLDNQVVSWGNVEFTKVSGEKITKTIANATPLVFKVACHQIISGIISVTNSKHSWTIDYGTGTCDNKAMLTKDGVSKEITLR
jgi:hypothetical protein